MGRPGGGGGWEMIQKRLRFRVLRVWVLKGFRTSGVLGFRLLSGLFGFRCFN